MTELLSLDFEELKSELGAGYRTRQIRDWLYKGAEFSEMTNLPKALREELAQKYIANPIVIREALSSRDTEKYIYALPDGNIIEGVRMTYNYGDTLCASTQVGCRMGCAFCASTIEGCVRNLTPGEILGQVILANRRSGGKIKNTVLMGSGEPFDNYDNVVKFLRLYRELGMSIRGVSLSTCGLAPRMLSFAEEGLPVTLCVSLHAPTDELRARIMPVARAYKIADIIAACHNYVEKTGRRVIFEYALIDKLNCDISHADELSRLLRGLQCHVNLIPLNYVAERDLNPPDDKTAAQFQLRLEQKKISVTRRRAMGADVGGACGQLRRSRITSEEGE